MKKFLKKCRKYYFQLFYNLPPKPKFGSERHLKRLEVQFGGGHEPVVGTVTQYGGDRMLIHKYGKVYSKIHRYKPSPSCVLEIGILKGVGLAMWEALWPQARIVGFDINIKNYQQNTPNLINRGAFKSSIPTSYIFDQLESNNPVISQVFKTGEVDLVFDDGLHSHDGIINSYSQLIQKLSEEYIYVIEDIDHFDDLEKLLAEHITPNHCIIKYSDKLCLIAPIHARKYFEEW